MGNLLINESPLLVLPTLAKKIGLNEAIFIQQLHFWLNNSNHEYEGHKWVYNTYLEWQEQFAFWSVNTIRRIIARLEKENLIITANFNRVKIDRTKWYRINYELLNEIEKDENGLGNQKTAPESEKGNTKPENNKQATRLTENINPLDHSTRPNEALDCSVSSDDLLNLDSPTDKNEQSICPKWADEVPKVDKPIPENTSKKPSENTSKNLSKQHPERIHNEENHDQLNPYQFFEEHGFGTLNAFLSEKISYWTLELSDELVIEAMKRALKYGVKRWNYVEAILRNWTDQGFQSLAEIEAADAQHNKNKRKRKPAEEPRNGRYIPEHFVLNLEEEV